MSNASSRMLALAAAAALAPSAPAVTLTFSQQATDVALTTYSEKGFTLTALSGQVPNASYDYATPGIVGDGGNRVIALPGGMTGFVLTGGTFTLGGFDYVRSPPQPGPPDYGAYGIQLTGYLNGVKVATSPFYSGSVSATFGAQLLDRVVFLQQGFNRQSIYLDDIVVEGLPAAPEPAAWAMMVIGFGMLGCAMRLQKTGLISTGQVMTRATPSRLGAR